MPFYSVKFEFLSQALLHHKLQYLVEDDLQTWLLDLSKMGQDQAWTVRHGAILAISSILRHSVSKISPSSSSLSVTVDIIKGRARDDKVWFHNIQEHEVWFRNI